MDLGINKKYFYIYIYVTLLFCFYNLRSLLGQWDLFCIYRLFAYALNGTIQTVEVRVEPAIYPPETQTFEVRVESQLLVSRPHQSKFLEHTETQEKRE